MADAYLVTVVDGVAFGLVYFCLAAGLAVIFGAADTLNLAHGTLYLAGAWLAWRVGGRFGDKVGEAAPGGPGFADLALAIALAVVAGAAAGWLLAVATAPLRRNGDSAGAHLDQALLTLGLSLAGAEAFAVATGGDPVPAQPPAALSGSVTVAGHTYPAYRLAFIGVAAVLAFGIWFAVERSRLGAVVRAAVADRPMLAALGYRPDVVLAALFAAGGAVAVASGVLAAPLLPAAPGADEHVLVMSLVVVVIGGVGSIRATLAGALLVGQVETLGRALVPELAGIGLFAVMAAALTLRPHGLVLAGRSV